MTQRYGVTAWAASALALVALAGCADNPASPPSATSSRTHSSKPTPASPSRTAESPSVAAASNATATVHRYFATIDELAQHPRSSLKPLAAVTTSTELAAERRFLRGEHNREQRQIGNTRIAELRVQSVDLDNSDPSAGKVPTAVIDVCWDVSKVDVVGKNGKSIVSPKRPDTGWTRYIVANYNFASDPSGGWRVASGQDLEQTPCAAS